VGDGATPWSGCTECAVLGDSSVAVDGGACAPAFSNCFGDGSEGCAGAGEPECCPLYDCIYSCDLNNDGVIDAGAELDCFCTNDDVQCVMNQLPGTCFGDYPNGLLAAVEWDTCLYQDVCFNICP